MDEAALRVTTPGSDGTAVAEGFDLPDFCARPMCRKEFRQTAGRGRKKDYCSDTCRRLADRDYKRAKAMVDQFEGLARRSRHDVLAFGRAADEMGAGHEQDDQVLYERAQAALGRAEAVLQFVGDADVRLVEELRTLCERVRPLVDRARAS